MKKLLFIFLILVLSSQAYADTGTVTSTYYIYDTEATYAAVHASASGSNDSSSGPQIGQTSAFRIYRGYLNVTIPALASCTSAYLYLYGDADHSTTDFEIMLYQGSWSETVSSAEWEEWDGWVPNGPHTGSSFVDIGKWSTSDFAVGWNIIELNAAGRAAVLAAQGDTLRIALISKEEVDYSQPAGDEYVSFEGMGATAPYLMINDYPTSGTYSSYSILGADGFATGTNATYVTQRDAAASATTALTNIIFGQNEAAGPVYHSYRSFLSFPIPAMGAASSVTLNLKGAGADYSSDNFNVKIYTSTYGGSLDTGDYDAFDGWQNGIAFDGTVLNDTWNSSSFNSNTWETITLNAAGRAAVLAAQGGTLYISILSEEDVNRSAPTGHEYLSFLSTSGSPVNTPYLEITYTQAAAPASSTSLSGIKAEGISF